MSAPVSANRNLPTPDSPPVVPIAAPQTTVNPSSDGPPSPTVALAGSPLAIARRARRQSSIALNNTVDSHPTGSAVATHPSPQITHAPQVMSSNTSAASRSLGIAGSAVGDGSGSASPVGSPAASLYGHPLRPPSVVNGSFGARSAAALGALPHSHSGAGLDSVAGASTSLTGPLHSLVLGVGVDTHVPFPVMYSPARNRSSSDFGGGTSAHVGALSASLSGPGSALASPGILRPTPMPQPLAHTAGHPMDSMASSPPGTRPVLLGPLFETSGDEPPTSLMSIAFHRSASQQSTHSSGAPLPLSALDGKHRRRQGAGTNSCSSVVLAGLESSGRNDHWQGLSTDPTPTHVIDGDAPPPPAHRSAFSVHAVRTGSEDKGRAGADTATTSGSGDTTDKSTEPPSPWSPAQSACPSPLFTPPIVPSQPIARRSRAPALSPLVWGMPLAKPPPSPGGDKAHRDSGGPASPGARSVMSVGCRPSALAAVPAPALGAIARSQSCHSLDESSLDSTVIAGAALGSISKVRSHRTSTGNIEPRTSKGPHGSASGEQPPPHASRQISDSYGITQSGSHSRTTSPSPPIGSAASPSRLVRQLQRQRFPLALSQAEMEVRRDGGSSQAPLPLSASRTATSSSTGRVVSASTVTASPSGSASPGPLKASTALAEGMDAPRSGVLSEDGPPSPHSDSRGSTDSRSQYEALFSQTVRTIDDDSVVGPTGEADSPSPGALSRQASSLVDASTRQPPLVASAEDDHETAMRVLASAASHTSETGVDRGSRGQDTCIDSWMHDTRGTTSHGDDSETGGTTGKDAQQVLHPSATGSPHAAYSSVTGVSVAPSPRTSNASNAPSMPQPVSLLLTASSPPPPQHSLPMHAEDGGGGAAGGSISNNLPAHGGLPPPPPMLNETMLANMHASVTPSRGQSFFPHSGGFEGDSLHSHDRLTAPSATDVDACTPRSLLAADSFVGARGSESFRGLPRLYSLPPDQREDNIIDFSLAGGGSSCALLRGHPPIPSFTGGPMQSSAVPKPRCVVTNISGPEGQRAPHGRVTAAAQAAIAKVSALTGSLVDHDVTSEGDLSDEEGGSRLHDTAAAGRPFGLPRRRISQASGHNNAGAESLDAPTAAIRPPLSATASSVCTDREPGAPQDAPLRLMSGRTPTPSRGGLLGPGGDVFRIDAGGASGSSSGAMMGGLGGAFQSLTSHQHMLIPFGSFSTASASAGGPQYNHSHSGGTRSTSSGLTAHRAGGVAGILTSAWNTSLVLSACSMTHSHSNSNSSGSNAPTANYLQQQGVTAAVGLRSGPGPSHAHTSSLEHVATVHSGGAAPNSHAAGQQTRLDSSSCAEAQVPPPASRSPPQQLPNFSILGNST